MDSVVVVQVCHSILPLCIMAVARAVALTFLHSKPVHCRVGTYSHQGPLQCNKVWEMASDLLACVVAWSTQTHLTCTVCY